MRQWNEKAMQRLSALLDERLPNKNQ
jgi:hypothetical protein